MGIYDRDWYREKHKPGSIGKRPEPPKEKPRQRKATHIETDATILRRIAVRRSTYERWLRSKETGLPRWFVALFVLLFFSLIWLFFDIAIRVFR